MNAMAKTITLVAISLMAAARGAELTSGLPSPVVAALLTGAIVLVTAGWTASERLRQS
jgi:hypothetical protein